MVSLLFGLAACDPGLAIDPSDKPDETDTSDTSSDSTTDSVIGDSGDTAGDGDSGETVDPLVDADGDGFLASEGDCDDTRANVYPGAEDACDSLDQDCDGEAVPEGSCSTIVDAEIAASRVIVGDGEGAYSYAFAVGDVDADGLQDLWIVNANTDHQGYSLFPGSELAHGGNEVDREWYTVWDGYPDYQLTGRVGAGDYDGNGYDDLWLSAQAYEPIGAVGGLYLFLGGPDRWRPGAGYALDATDGYWEDDPGASYAVGDVLAGGDLTGDGLDDALMRGILDDGDSLWWTLVPGTTDPPPFGASTSDFSVWIDTHGEEYGVSYSTAYFAGDLDGDGSDELLVQHDYDVGTASGMVLVEGEDVAGADGAWVGDLAQGFYFDDGMGDSVDVKVGVIPTGTPAADVDGDGLPNLAMFARTTSATGLDYTTCTLILSSGLPAGNFAGNELSKICTLDDPADGSESASYPISWTNDIDGDGGAELMVSRDTGAWSYEYNTCVVRSSIVALGGVIDALDPAFVPGPCYVYNASGHCPLWLDMTGDGLSDMVYGQDEYDDPVYGDRAGRIVVVDGFEIPWNDASKW